MREEVLTVEGNPDSLQVEILAIRRAGSILVQRGVEHFVIFTDNPDAAVRAGVEAAKWIPWSQNYAGFPLERLMRRGQYLRQSRKGVSCSKYDSIDRVEMQEAMAWRLKPCLKDLRWICARLGQVRSGRLPILVCQR